MRLSAKVAERIVGVGDPGFGEVQAEAAEAADNFIGEHDGLGLAGRGFGSVDSIGGEG